MVVTVIKMPEDYLQTGEDGTELGVVIEVNGNTVRVQPHQHQACSSCGSSSFCFPDSRPAPLIDARCDREVHVGDLVSLRQGEGTRIGAALAVFGIPVATMLAGTVVGMNASGQEAQGAVAGSLAGLMFGVLVVRAINAFVGAKGKLRPVVHDVVGHPGAPA